MDAGKIDPERVMGAMIASFHGDEDALVETIADLIEVECADCERTLCKEYFRRIKVASNRMDQAALVETQALHYDGREWQAYTYEWNDEGTDAALVERGGKSRTFTVADAAAPAASGRRPGDLRRGTNACGATIRGRNTHWRSTCRN